MEDGLDGTGSLAVLSPAPVNNGEVMANFPNPEDASPNPLKLNGELNVAESLAASVTAVPENDDSSDCDALVIDESASQPKKKKLKSTDEFQHTNPYFSESIFELSNQYNHKTPEQNSVKASKKGTGKKLKGKNGKPKLREYAQYLGLQPTVQFKCSKCGSSGFQSLQSHNEHLTQCTALTPPVIPPQPISNNTTNFRVTRKVFLCSACGTYYENWNLFLHMREVHKRFICLYCLGMFPHAEKLSSHLIAKHNCAPARFETVKDFFGAYKEPCFLMCCDCQTVFNEQQDFSNHCCILDIVKPQNVPEIESSATKPQLHDSAKPVVDVVSNDEAHDDSLKPTETDGGEATEAKPSSHEIIDNPDGENFCDIKLNNCNSDEISMIEDESNNALDGGKTVDEEEDGSHKEGMEAEEEEEQADSCNSDNEEDEEVNDYVDCGSDNCDNAIDKNKIIDSTVTEEESNEIKETFEDVRKVPKVTLKLPKLPSYNPPEEDYDEEYQSDDSEKLTMEVEKESDHEISNETLQEDKEMSSETIKLEEPTDKSNSENMVPTAGSEINVIELELEQPLDKFDIKLLLQKCLGATMATCLYCNHARKIAVNGKQLGMHAIAEHRYSAIVKSITAEELIPESFNTRIQECFLELENIYFNLESASAEGGVTFSHIFECFQCRYSTTVHKELYLHNRKLHAKAILLCIMCKTSFYSYSELVCHLCPGVYAVESDVQYRCCLCVSDDLPSAFRLMVHLRKKHHVCDVCLEMCHSQSRLSNHVWKHKLHHLCYRCGIAYRNKPDITKHLYWKHGTESVLCKKCLQKKWPHVYHFCIPPTTFSCEECTLSFSRAVSLMVHKRLHSEEYPHVCSEDNCTEKFISKKLLAKHDFKHRQPLEEVKEEMIQVTDEVIKETPVMEKENDTETNSKTNEEVESEETKPTEKPKPKVDVYDLPELNLSESDSSESEDEMQKTKPLPEETKPESILEAPQEDQVRAEEANPVPTEENPVLDNIWDNFKNYQANIAKLDILTDVGKEEEKFDESAILTDVPLPPTSQMALRDHDYCAPTMDTMKEEEEVVLMGNQEKSADHSYCTGNEQKPEIKDEKPVDAKPKLKEGRASSDSSSDSGSSCTCGSNCSCSSSSDSSSSTSDSSESDSSSEEGRRRQQLRRQKRKTKKSKQQETENVQVDVTATDNTTTNNTSQAPVPPPPTVDTPILESDLETTESDTDEDFYDKQPQKLANKLIAEKREKLLQMASGIGPYVNGSMLDSRPTTPNLPDEINKPKKKSKSKKKKKKKSAKHDMEAKHSHVPNPYAMNNSALSHYNMLNNSNSSLGQNNTHSFEADTNTRASKRRRVPNKFYGYSSDEEAEKSAPLPPSFKFRKIDLPTPKSPMVVPPITIKTTPSASPTVEPISIRMTAKPGEMRVQPLRLPLTKRAAPKIKPIKPPPMIVPQERDSGTESNSSTEEDETIPKIKEQPALYCYCRCPYDEVSEMIGCDSDDCAIEWFHFECVGIMVPPKGQWYCPDCRKKKQQRREMLQAQMSS